LLLDVGCNWGRWSISGARNGWNVVGIDPSLGAIMAARRAFRNERNVMFVCGDARFLPFKDDTFHCVFSYSVIQYLSEVDAETALAEIGRALGQNGYSKIQMAHRGGLRSACIRTRPDYAAGGIFLVRYWSLVQIRKLFRENIGPSIVIPEAFGGLGLLADDWLVVSAKTKVLVVISTILKIVDRVIRPLIQLAGSVYVVSIKS
jgi:ubiquinone/menaquinone biosynthesis C-methylase UbiE